MAMARWGRHGGLGDPAMRVPRRSGDARASAIRRCACLGDPAMRVPRRSVDARASAIRRCACLGDPAMRVPPRCRDGVPRRDKTPAEAHSSATALRSSQ